MCVCFVLFFFCNSANPTGRRLAEAAEEEYDDTPGRRLQATDAPPAPPTPPPPPPLGPNELYGAITIQTEDMHERTRVFVFTLVHARTRAHAHTRTR